VADDVLTEQEAADYLKLSLEQYRELQAGPKPIPALELIPGQPRLLFRDLQQWLEEARTRAGRPATTTAPSVLVPTATSATPSSGPRLRTGPKRRHAEHRLEWMPY
jgi:hypothetical protein